MITVAQQRSTSFPLVIFLLIASPIRVDAVAGRCYLCSQNTLAECAGSTQPDSVLYNTILQYYTEPCNGQCVLFRNENTSTIRGCSWTYGHMAPKATGWHELSPGVRAYFCDSHLCNNGTYEQPEKAMISEVSSNDEFIPPPQQTLSPQQLFILAGHMLPVLHTEHRSPPIAHIPRQLRQCYSCTAHLKGCDEFLDPSYVSKYIRPCPGSCIIFRNPNDHYVITRDCSISWPSVHVKSGLHKLLGSDAFFCQESLCNGISFDFIMGIFHNQLPAVITFPPALATEDLSTTTALTATEAITDPLPASTIVSTNDDPVIWEDPDLDFVLVEPTSTTVSLTTTSLPLSPELPDDIDVIYESSTVSLLPIEHFELLNDISASSTISGGAAVAEQDSEFNWWDVDDAQIPAFTGPALSPSTTTPAWNILTLIPSTSELTAINDDDEWAIFNTTSMPSVTPLNHLSESNAELDFDMNDYFTGPHLSTTASVDSMKNHSSPLNPFFFNNHDTKEHFSGLNKPVSPTLAIPPFSWMLHLANQNKSALQSRRQSSINKTRTATSSTTTSTDKIRKKKNPVILKGKTGNHLEHVYDHCHRKQCQNGGRLNADCLCVCLPAFTGDHCEIVHCDQEPAHICGFVLAQECKSDYVRYLCPQFCQMPACAPKKSS